MYTIHCTSKKNPEYGTIYSGVQDLEKFIAEHSDEQVEEVWED